jgi:ELWxxDGT repeat protein
LGTYRTFTRCWLVTAALVLSGGSAVAQSLQLVRDANRTVQSQATPVAQFGSGALAEMCTDEWGCQLWATDGTTAGTHIVKRFSTPGVTGITSIGSKAILFTDRNMPQNFWVTDGTDAGTVPLRSFWLPTGGTGVLGNTAYFGADGSIWKSDGTAAGTVAVSDGGYATVALGSVFFSRNGPTSTELWRTDGTPGAATKISDLGGKPGDAVPSPVFEAGARIFYFGAAAYPNRTILSSDGTAGGTVAIAVFPASALLFGVMPPITVAGSNAYWLQYNGTGADLWRSDGSLAGTGMIATFASTDLNLVALGSDLVISARFGDRVELWRTNGTAAATALFRTWPGTPAPVFGPARELQGSLYFLVDYSLWKTQGTDATTQMISADSLAPWGNAGTRLLFANYAVANTVWSSDGTAPGTVPLEVAPDQPSASSGYCGLDNRTIVVGGIAYYVATDGEHGCELWRSDGTLAGTFMVKDIFPGSPGSIRSAPVAMGGRIYFFANPGVASTSAQLWSSDGTAAGTLLVKDIPPPANAGLSDIFLAATDSMLYFTTRDLPHSAYAMNFWKSDGTESGTVLLDPGAFGQYPSTLRGVGPLLFYNAQLPAGTVLMRTDGTAAGTFTVTPPAPGDLAVFSGVIAETPHLLYFLRTKLGAGTELWRTDGSLAGTFMVLSDSATAIGTMGDSLVFRAQAPGGGVQSLWITDGTAETLRFIRPDMGALPGQARIGNSLVFPATDGSIWATDGTDAGTRQIDAGYFPDTVVLSIASARGTAFISGQKAGGGLAFAASSGSAASTQRLIETSGLPGDATVVPTVTSSAELAGGLIVWGRGDGKGLERYLVPFDSSPDAAVFPAKTDVSANSLVTSDPVLISGTNVQFPVSASGGEVCISSANGCACDLAPFATSVTANFGQYLCARHFASPLASTTVTTNVDMGGTPSLFSSTTAAASAATVAFESTSASVREDGTVTLRVLRYGSAAGPLSVNWTTIDASAQAGVDFGTPGSPSPVTGSISWADGDATPRLIVIGGPMASVPLIDDDVVEPQKAFQVQLQTPSAPVNLVNGTATITLDDDDAAITFAAATATAYEGAIVDTVLTVTRAGRTDNTVRVGWTTANGTAIAGSDFGVAGSSAQVSGVLVFLPGETTRQITIGGSSSNIRIIDDTEQELDETFKVTLAAPTNGAVLGAVPEVLVTLVSNENVAALDSATKDVAENAGSVQLTIRRFGSTAGALSVGYATVDGSALAGQHYTATSGTLTWPAGDASPKTVLVPILDNLVPNATRSFQFRLSGSFSVGTPAVTTINILDDDSQVQFTAGATSVREGTPALTLTVTRQGVTTHAASVTWTVGGGTAIPGTDYSGPTSGTLQWAANDAAPKTITIPIIDDAIPEPPKNFTVALSSPVNTSVGAIPTVSVLLEDDDNGFLFSAPTYSVSEANPSVTLQVNRLGVATTAASVRWTAVNGTATAGKDFGSRGAATPPSGTLIWQAGDSNPKVIVIPMLQDSLVEGTESFTVVLGTPSAGMVIGTPGTATVSIADDEIPFESKISFSQAKYVIVENAGSAVLTVRREPIGAGFTVGATVSYATQPGTALVASDYAKSSGTISWSPSDGADKTITVPIVNDTVAEPIESFKVLLSTPSAGVQIATPDATVAILDDDDAFPLHGAVPADWTVPAVATKGWHVSNDLGAYEGVFSLRSDAIGDNETAQVEVTRAFGAGNVAFRYRVSSEPVFDRLRFFVDGVEKGSWSGTAVPGWTLFTTPITAGAHTLRWSYEKDGAISVGSDAAWIDAVTLP